MQTLLTDGVHDAADPAVLQKLRDLHPSAPPAAQGPLEGAVGSAGPLLPELSDECLATVLDAVRTFPNGSAPGPSGLRPSILQGLLCSSQRSGELLRALGTFVQACINGTLPPSLAPLLYAARLIPLRKKDEAVRRWRLGMC